MEKLNGLGLWHCLFGFIFFFGGGIVWIGYCFVCGNGLSSLIRCSGLGPGRKA